jgi:hypothetical protein
MIYIGMFVTLFVGAIFSRPCILVSSGGTKDFIQKSGQSYASQVLSTTSMLLDDQSKSKQKKKFRKSLREEQKFSHP